MHEYTLKQLLSQSKKIKDDFSKRFLEIYLDSGFVSMSKHDIDLLVYHLISSQTDLLENISNHDLSDLLHIQESKIKNIKLDSFLKYSEKSHKKALKDIINLLENGKIKPELEKDKIRFILDDPVLMREFEFAVKNIGHVIDYSFNKEIISIKILTFLVVLRDKADNSEKFEKDIIKNLRDALKKEKEVESELKKCTTIEQVSKVLSKIRSVVTNEAVSLILINSFNALIKIMVS
jgi:hypothetical protein